MFESVLKAAPNAIPALLGKAQVCTLQNRNEEALALSDRVIANLSPLLALAYTNKSLVYLKEQKFTETLENTGKVLAILPNAGQALVARGVALASLGKFQDAIKAYPPPKVVLDISI